MHVAARLKEDSLDDIEFDSKVDTLDMSKIGSREKFGVCETPRIGVRGTEANCIPPRQKEQDEYVLTTSMPEASFGVPKQATFKIGNQRPVTAKKDRYKHLSIVGQSKWVTNHFGKQ